MTSHATADPPTSSPAPRVSFGIIVFNGEPFTRYCLRALYPFAHEIIVVEGGHEGTAAVATPDGHSTDGTLESIQAFLADEDPEHKVRLVTRDGFWPMTDELGRRRTAQSRAYAELATGDYLWQVDIDEFYLPQDMQRVLDMLASDPCITQVSFPFVEFWSRPTYQLGSSRLLRRGQVHRLFKWAPGYRYVTHQPPIVHDDQDRDLRDLQWVRPETMERMGIRMYHYSHLLPSQMEQKAHVYRGQEPVQFGKSLDWFRDSYQTLRRPYQVERHYYWPSWLERFEGPQPPEIERLMSDIESGRLDVELRPVDDAERLLRSLWYPLGAQALRAAEPFHQAWRFGRPPLANLLRGRIPRRLRRSSTDSDAARPSGAESAAAAPVSAGAADRPGLSGSPGPSVVFFAPYFEVPHGMAATNRLLLLARALAHAGARPLILSVLPSNRGRDAVNVVTRGSVHGVPYEYLSPSPVKARSFARRRLDEVLSWSRAVWRLQSLRRQGRLDAVYLWPRSLDFAWTRPLALAVARQAGGPVLLESNERPWSTRPRQSWIERRVSPLHGIDGVVCISEYLAAWSAAEAARRGLGTRVLQVPILVDCDEHAVAPCPDGPPVLVFAASPAYRTTAEFILEAMEQVWPTHPDARLVITGVDPGGRGGAWLAERRAAGQLDERVDLPGHVSRDELLSIYRNAHALLIPLFDDVQSEARFPTKIGEYLAAARPVVTTPVGEIPRYFTHLEDAFIAGGCDVPAYAAAVREVLADGERAERIGLAGRALCECTFDYRIHGAALSAFIADLAARHTSPRPSEEATP